LTKQHTHREFARELQELKERLLIMGGLVEEMIAKSIRALVERDVPLAKATIGTDNRVNRYELETDALCLHVLARRQPLASDLRLITLVLKVVTDLERIGDLAVNICERAIDLAVQAPLKPYADIPRMATIVQGMVRDAIDAFVDRDVPKARAVIERDDEADRLYVKVFREVLDIMRADPTAVERGIHIQSVAKFLERIADHGTNLTEQVILLVQGADVRHVGKLGG